MMMMMIIVINGRRSRDGCAVLRWGCEECKCASMQRERAVRYQMMMMLMSDRNCKTPQELHFWFYTSTFTCGYCNAHSPFFISATVATVECWQIKDSRSETYFYNPQSGDLNSILRWLNWHKKRITTQNFLDLLDSFFAIPDYRLIYAALTLLAPPQLDRMMRQLRSLSLLFHPKNCRLMTVYTELCIFPRVTHDHDQTAHLSGKVTGHRTTLFIYLYIYKQDWSLSRIWILLLRINIGDRTGELLFYLRPAISRRLIECAAEKLLIYWWRRRDPLHSKTAASSSSAHESKAPNHCERTMKTKLSSRTSSGMAGGIPQ